MTTRDLPQPVGTGVFMTAAWFCIFNTLSTGDAIIVTPLAGLHPLLVAGLGKLFLKDKSEVSSKIVVGALESF